MACLASAALAPWTPRVDRWWMPSGRSTSSSSHARIYAAVRRIPRGRVATYGQIAKVAGLPGHARLVGYALNTLPDDDDAPWHRVVNARGTISPRADPTYVSIQRALLEAEGIEFDRAGRIALTRYGWRPRRRS